MRLVLQRVKEASVTVEGEAVGSIGTGLVVLVGFGADDDMSLPSSNAWSTLINKMLDLRIFADADGKMNLGLRDCGGEVLLVSQFTLYAECRKGRRPSFTSACPPAMANALYDQFVADAKKALPAKVHTGQFGAMMDVALTNWGPVTITLSHEQFI